MRTEGKSIHNEWMKMTNDLKSISPPDGVVSDHFLEYLEMYGKVAFAAGITSGMYLLTPLTHRQMQRGMAVFEEMKGFTPIPPPHFRKK